MASDGILEIISNGWVGSDVLCKNGGAGCGGENSCFLGVHDSSERNTVMFEALEEEENIFYWEKAVGVVDIGHE